MEELTIGDKTYISSKRAAEITGYAKDYVGQLCREGRVTATLVGRSWYVLESAIREHRFGGDNAETKGAGAAESKASRFEAGSTWSAPRYTPEDVSYISRTPEGFVVRPGVNLLTEEKAAEIPYVPQQAQKTEQPEAIEAPQTEEANPDVLVEMQSAWQDWFKERELAAPEEIAEAEITQEAPEARYEPVIEDSPATAVELHIQREMPPAPILEVQEAEEETESPIYITPVRSSYVPRALMLAVAGLAILVAVIGTGSLDFIAKQGSIQASTINFLGGIEQYQKASK